MGMGKRKRSKQDSLFIPTASLARSSSHDFYERLNQVLSADGIDDFVEDLCEPFYVQGKGRPSGRQGSVDGQRLYRTPLALSQVRVRLPTRFPRWSPGFQQIGTWVRYYNEERPHSSHAGDRTPMEVDTLRRAA